MTPSTIWKYLVGFSLVLSVLLAACDRDSPTTNTAVPTQTQQTTATPTAKPTQTALPPTRATGTLHPTATLTSQPTTAPTIIPTQTPTLDPNPFPAVPITSFAANDYHLQPPDPKLFLDVIEMVLRENQSVGTSAVSDYGRELIREGRSAFSLFLSADLDNYYPNGLPNAARIIEDESYASDAFIVYPEPYLEQIIRTALLEHINENGFLSTAEFDITPFPLNLDQSLQPMWLVEVRVSRYSLVEWIPFHLTEAGEYQIIDNDLYPTLSIWNTEADLTHDLTGDGIPEVILVQDDYLLAGRYGGFVSVNTWDGDRLRYLDRIDFSAYYRTGGVEQEIGDFDEDGREEIRIIQHHYANYDCSWDEISTYQWNGLQSNFTTTGSQMPDSPLCDTARALGFSSSANTAEKIQLLEGVLQELTLETAPSADFLAHIRVRLAMLYASKGQDDKAWQVLAGIAALPNDSVFVQFVKSHLETADDSLISLCDSMYSAIDIPPGPRLGTEIDEYISIGGYPMDGSPSPDAVCPLSSLIPQRITSGKITSEEGVSQSFSNLDLPYTLLQEINLDSDPDLEQIGLVGLSEKKLIILDSNGNDWTPTIMSAFYLPIADYQIELRDVNNDNRPEILILVTLENSDCGWINAGMPDRSLSIIEVTADGSFVMLNRQQICEETVELSTLDVTAYLYTPPFWAELAAGFPWTGVNFREDDNFYDYLDQLTTEVINQEKPFEETLLSLETVMNSLPDDNLLSDIIRPRLLFTLGYHYELNGDETYAVETYLELINLAPRSPWSWLAWMRLETK